MGCALTRKICPAGSHFFRISEPFPPEQHIHLPYQPYVLSLPSLVTHIRVALIQYHFKGRTEAHSEAPWNSSIVGERAAGNMSVFFSSLKRKRKSDHNDVLLLLLLLLLREWSRLQKGASQRERQDLTLIRPKKSIFHPLSLLLLLLISCSKE